MSIGFRNRSAHYLWNFLSIFSGLALTPLVFTAGYYSHHDGLILANSRMLRNAMTGGGDWPFNQYGSFGIIPQTLFSFFFPSDFLLVALRIFTLLCYWLTGWLLYKTSKLVLPRNLSSLAVVIFFLSQPFNGSNFLPWASSFLMPVIMGHVYLISLQLSINRDDSSVVSRNALFAGCLIPLMLLSRAQIGILVFLSTFLVLVVAKKLKYSISYLVGFCISVVTIALGLLSKGWLRESLFDEFAFGSVYIKYKDVSHMPIPVFTIIGTTIFVLVFFNFERLSIRLRLSGKIEKALALAVLLGVFVAGTLVLISRETTFSASYFTALGRFWICLSLACLIFFGFESLKGLTLEAIRGYAQEPTTLLPIFFLLTGIAAQFQIWPFFDSMHFWWGFVPAVLIVLLSLNRVIPDLESILDSNFRLRMTSALLAAFVIASPLLAALNTPRESLNLYGSGGIKINQSDAKVNSDTSAFLEENLPEDSRVLNLCQNPDVFLTQRNITSATRYFVFWPHMKYLPQITESFLESDPDFVVTCTLDEFNSDTQDLAELQRDRLLSSVMPTRILVAEFRNSKLWQIWKSSEN